MKLKKLRESCIQNLSHQGRARIFTLLFVCLFVASLYGYVVWQDRRMPEVVLKNQQDVFSEERARTILNKIANLGPRPSGSHACEVDAFKILTDKINKLDVQRPSGCFDLKFLSSSPSATIK
uniref:Uncharacterized protein n=1 Tax=Ditylenchus dipsaci TaxID=166011 RepID=A0A915EUY6_9BILA